jgi:hypothetical protein
MIICYATKIGQTNKSIWEFSVTTVGNFQILHYDSVSDDLEKLKLGSIEEQYHEYVAGEKTDLYEPLDNENAKDEQSGANEESANHQIRETEESILTVSIFIIHNFNSVRWPFFKR